MENLYTNSPNNADECHFDDFAQILFQKDLNKTQMYSIFSEDDLENPDKLVKFLLDLLLSGIKILTQDQKTIFDIEDTAGPFVLLIKKYFAKIFIDVEIRKEKDPHYFLEIKKNNLPLQLNCRAPQYVSYGPSKDRICLTDYSVIFFSKEWYKIIFKLVKKLI